MPSGAFVFTFHFISFHFRATVGQTTNQGSEGAVISAWSPIDMGDRVCFGHIGDSERVNT